MTGAVLAGGQSRRFGRNKTLEVFGGKRLIDRAVDSLCAFCDPVMVVANDLALYTDLGRMLVRDLVPRQGPLGGIYTALLHSRGDWVFVKAADMPVLVPELAAMICAAREGYDAVVPCLGERHDPLLALYNRACLPAIARQLETPRERRIIAFFSKIRVHRLPEELWREVDPEGISFRNVNTVQDLAELKWT